MTLTNTLTKKILEKLIHETFQKFGKINTSALLDSIKLLGFSSATAGGISISLEDLKTPEAKKKVIEETNRIINHTSFEWSEGKISEVERFQRILDSWNLATEGLKNRIVDCYANYEPTNPLYLMAFSGARGNMSQVRQLVGMRGLMSDPQGKIVDLPIQKNFREGLSPVDYIISSYGARKGIVDTALKTADAGYLTRRLIYVGQSLVVNAFECKNAKNPSFRLKLIENDLDLLPFLGRTLSILPLERSFKNFEILSEQILDEILFKELIKQVPFQIQYRSVLTCQIYEGLCQRCYGWDLSKRTLVNIGEAVGVIAAQSIGEPGTQLTMRTFHTGGIFTGELATQIFSPVSGKLIFPVEFDFNIIRSPYGSFAYKIQEQNKFFILNWQGEKKELILERGSLLYLVSSKFVKKGQLLAEILSDNFYIGSKKMRPILSPSSGELIFQNLSLRQVKSEENPLKIAHTNGIIWIRAGEILLAPKHAFFSFNSSLQVGRPYASVFFQTPKQALIAIEKDQIRLFFSQKSLILNYQNFSERRRKENELKFISFSKNYQYLDSYTYFGCLNFFCSVEGKIYLIRKRAHGPYSLTFCVALKQHIYHIWNEQVRNYLFFPKKPKIFRSQNFLHSTLKLPFTAFCWKRKGTQMFFQKAYPVFLNKGAIVKYKSGSFIIDQQPLASLISYRQQTTDIVQGLPKIEQLIEVFKPKVKACLAYEPGICLGSSASYYFHFVSSVSQKSKLHWKGNFQKELMMDDPIAPILKKKAKKEKTNKEFQKLEEEYKRKKDKKRKRLVYLANAEFLFGPSYIFRDQPYNVFLFHKDCVPRVKPKKCKEQSERYYWFRDEKNNKFAFLHGKRIGGFWKKSELGPGSNIIFYSKKGDRTPYFELDFKKPIYQNQDRDIVAYNSKGNLVLLENLPLVKTYAFPPSLKAIPSKLAFVGLGEPLSEGNIEVQEFLHLLVQYHIKHNEYMVGSILALHGFQIILLSSIQSIYAGQGVRLDSKHFESIIRQMTHQGMITGSGDTPLYPGELLSFATVQMIYSSLKDNKRRPPIFEPTVISATQTTLTRKDILTPAAFQETKRVLTIAALLGYKDWLTGLKERIITGKIINAGTGYLNIKHNLDIIYVLQK
jgi:RNA polymerase Rpb1, domain 5/RNA polymerase Rpb1, domain 4